MLNHHPTKFGVHRPCESGDITFFIYHVTPEASRDFVGGVPSS